MQIVIPYRIPGLPVIPWLRAAVRTNAVQQFSRLDTVLWADREAFRQEMYSRYPALRPGQVELILGWPWPDPEPADGSPWSDGWSDGFGTGAPPPTYTHELTSADLTATVLGFNPSNGSITPPDLDGWALYAFEVNSSSNFVRLTPTDPAVPWTAVTVEYAGISIRMARAGNRYDSPTGPAADDLYNALKPFVGSPVGITLTPEV
ncbi:bacterial Ig-like domain family protein [Vibrio phage vB_VpaP_KF2]|uniref:Bacterial Ig-like domain family protein n=1 Tax=Vibrio phage vB_VpaP_KF2 TaxID=2041473 RepID=A0A384WJ65_9CAUD|nr:bacterial Ig-like domain family protein [Vibrio phage vB_VpaP_KF2]ATI19074.1 bacterial Ig-like domain family protein [Vibrio phage vB_VpaP_KF2]